MNTQSEEKYTTKFCCMECASMHLVEPYKYEEINNAIMSVETNCPFCNEKLQAWVLLSDMPLKVLEEYIQWRLDNYGC